MDLFIPNTANTQDQGYQKASREPLTIWGRYWKYAKAYDADMEKDWKDDLDTLLIVVSAESLSAPGALSDHRKF